MATRTDAIRRWYQPRRRDYPWRRNPAPYRVLVSELMLQQTQAARVEPIFEAFLRRFPSVRALAAAPRAEVLRAWNGLGYNRRAVALHRAAGDIVVKHGGRVPSDLPALCDLPGVGPYTAAAVASIAFDQPIPLVDTNVRRVLARAALGVDAPDADESDIARIAAQWLDRERPREHNQALMDLGRAVCRATSPLCGDCPLAPGCRFRRDGGVTKPLRRRQSMFEGSLRQLRGAVVREVGSRGGVTIATLASTTGQAPERVGEAVRGLVADGMVEAGPAALAGHPTGRVRPVR